MRGHDNPRKRNHFFGFFGACDKADAETLLTVLAVDGLLKSWDACDATFFDVSFAIGASFD
jgi:hypothetical protein